MLRAALDYAREGNVLVAWKLDRLGRSLPHLIETVAALERRGVGFRSLAEAIDTTTPGGRSVFHLLAALAPAQLCGTPTPPAERPEFAAEVSWDLPSLAAGATALLHVTVTGAHVGDLAQASPATSSRFFELDVAAWSNNTVRVLARNVSDTTIDLAAAMLSVHVAKRRMP
jgi:resolvase-like protein